MSTLLWKSPRLVFVAQTLVCHVAFSVIAVKLYLEPVLEALKMGQAVHASKQCIIVKQREGEEKKDDPDDDEDADALEGSIHNNGGIDAAERDYGIKQQMGTLQKIGTLNKMETLQQIGIRAKQAYLDEGVSAGHKDLKKKRRWQVYGVSAILISSTLLLMNVAAFVIFPKKLDDTWLNVFIGGFNLDSILFSVGIALICGGGVKRVASDHAKEKQAVGAAVTPASFVPNSDVSSVYRPSEINEAQADHKSTCPLQSIGELGQTDGGEAGQQEMDDTISLPPFTSKMLPLGVLRSPCKVGST